MATSSTALTERPSLIDKLHSLSAQIGALPSDDGLSEGKKALQDRISALVLKQEWLDPPENPRLKEASEKLYEKGRGLYRNKNITGSVVELKAAAAVARQIKPNDYPLLTKIYQKLASSLLENNQVEEGIAVCELGFKAAEQTFPVNLSTIATFHRYLSFCYSKKKMWAFSLEQAKKGLNVLIKETSGQLEPQDHYNLCWLYVCKAKAHFSLEHFSRALKAVEGGKEALKHIENDKNKLLRYMENIERLAKDKLESASLSFEESEEETNAHISDDEPSPKKLRSNSPPLQLFAQPLTIPSDSNPSQPTSATARFVQGDNSNT